MSTVVGQRSLGSAGEPAADTTVLSVCAMPARRGGLATIDLLMLMLVLVALLQMPMDFGFTALGLILFVPLSFVLLLLSEKLVPNDRGSLVLLTEIAVVPVVLAISSLLAFLVLHMTGTDVDGTDVVGLWLLASACVVAGRAALSSTTAGPALNRVVTGVDRMVKRAIDVVIAGTLLVLTLPIALALSVAIRLEDRGPILYRCRRIGQGGREFDMLKFRKMESDAEGPPLTAPDDGRFTRVGRFLARSKLDELPQLWNILCGQMSLVGPRPEDPDFVALHPAVYETITTIKPGITGLCQLAFAKESQLIGDDDPVQVYAERFLPQKLGIDLLYVHQGALALDLKILCWTAIVLVRKDVAVHRETGRLTLRRTRETSAEAA